ncbi:hypothetical protein [Geminicoccus flavidas]|uniref:hypothetical protein n=1 Tax=Geminicoccus flavidas TaxID=2506407 RepID=UPI00135BAB3B|nr:hypothetical protein [Geminicoccus flavidas]
MTKIALPASLAHAIREAEAIEAKIARTRQALLIATDRTDRAQVEVIQAQAERDRLAAEHDLALGAVALDEVPEVPPATLAKEVTAAAKRLASERAELDAAQGARRGLEARLAREAEERTKLLEAIEQAKGEARLALAEQATAVLDRVTAILTTELVPLAQADLAVGGGYLARCLDSIRLSEFCVDNGQPSRAGKLDHAMRSATMPPEFARVDMTVRKLRAAAAEARAEAEVVQEPANDLQAA